METEFPLKDLILYRISQNRSLLELKIFGNFEEELQKLLRSGMIQQKQQGKDPALYPYEFVLTVRGAQHLYR